HRCAPPGRDPQNFRRERRPISGGACQRSVGAFCARWTQTPPDRRERFERCTDDAAHWRRRPWNGCTVERRFSSLRAHTAHWREGRLLRGFWRTVPLGDHTEARLVLRRRLFTAPPPKTWQCTAENLYVAFCSMYPEP